LPYLQGLITSRNEKGKSIPPAQPTLLAGWAASTAQLVTALPPAQLFPLFDMWRLALLDPAVTIWLASGSLHINPLVVILKHTRELLADNDAAVVARNTILTALRLLANALGLDVLAHTLMADSAPVRATDVLVPGLLHADGAVRTAAASVAFNLAVAIQRSRVERVKAGRSDALRDTLDGEWEVEMLSAVVEAVQREESSEDVGKYPLSIYWVSAFLIFFY
jgi:desumoylating isopeptidase 1